MLYHREKYEQEKNGAAITLTKLTHDDIWPRGFQRMRVKYSSKIFSENVSSALIAHKQLFPEFKPCHPTAVLIMETAKWFKAVANYHSDNTISSTNFNRFKTIVINFAHLIVRGKFIKTHYPEDFPQGYQLPKSAIKPIQSSIAISSTSLIMLASKILEFNDAKLFTANFTQDCVESLFGELRAEGNGNPSPLRVLQLLKFRIISFWNMTNKNWKFFNEQDSENLLSNFKPPIQ